MHGEDNWVQSLREIMSFYGISFPQYPEFEYELLRQYDACVNQMVQVRGFHLSLVKYWQLDHSKTVHDDLHMETEEEKLVFKDPYIFPCYFKESQPDYSLGKMGMEQTREPSVLKPVLSVLAVLGLAVQEKPGEPVILKIGPGDRFQFFAEIYEVVSVAKDTAIDYLNTAIPFVYKATANLARDLSLEMPNRKQVFLPDELLQYKDSQVTQPTP